MNRQTRAILVLLFIVACVPHLARANVIGNPCTAERTPSYCVHMATLFSVMEQHLHRAMEQPDTWVPIPDHELFALLLRDSSRPYCFQHWREEHLPRPWSPHAAYFHLLCSGGDVGQVTSLKWHPEHGVGITHDDRTLEDIRWNLRQRLLDNWDRDGVALCAAEKIYRIRYERILCAAHREGSDHYAILRMQFCRYKPNADTPEHRAIEQRFYEALCNKIPN